jgi:hypothetical protein
MATDFTIAQYATGYLRYTITYPEMTLQIIDFKYDLCHEKEQLKAVAKKRKVLSCMSYYPFDCT